MLKELYSEPFAYIFGAGDRGQFTSYGLKEKGVKVLGFLDNDRSKVNKFEFGGVKCIGLEEISNNIPIVVAIAEKYHDEIREQMESLNAKVIYYLTDDLYMELYCNISDESIIKCRWMQRKPEVSLDLENPKSFNEKIQWMKLNDRRKAYIYLSDKLKVKEWLKNKNYRYLNIIPTLGVWDDFEKIDFESLPEQFVLKPTHDSGSIVFCQDKKQFDINSAREKIVNALATNYYWYDREWGYKGITPRIIAEPYLTDESEFELKDYKMQCMNGRVELIQVDFGRFAVHKRNLYDRNWNFIDGEIKYPSDKSHIIPRPDNLEIMIDIAEQMSQPFPYVRIDLYDINNEVYFGEYTFYHGGGYEKITPYELDLELGLKMTLERN